MTGQTGDSLKHGVNLIRAQEHDGRMVHGRRTGPISIN